MLMPVRIMAATIKAAHAMIDRNLTATERVLLPKGKLRDLERKRVDRIIKELYDELYGEGRE